MTSKERLLRLLKGEPVDRVPVSTYELTGWNRGSWHNDEPSYARLMEKIRRDTDCFCMWGPMTPPEGAGMFLTAAGLETESHSRREGDYLATTHVVHTPGGELKCVTKVKENVHTTWTVEPWLKSDSDVERFFSIPYEFSPPEVESAARTREELGEHGVVMADVADPLCLAAAMFEFGEFTVRALTDRDGFKALVELYWERVRDRLRALVENDVAPIYRIYGAEYASEPYLPPELFMEYEYPYLAEMVEMIQSGGAVARVHSHGRLRGIVDAIRDTGARALDPCEGPPDGDMTLGELRAALGGEVILLGNVELRTLEAGTEEDVRAEVERCMREAKGGGGYCIIPTASPIDVPLSEKTERNYFVFIDAALELGRMY